MFYGSIVLGLIFLIKNCFLSALIYFEGKLIRSIRINLGDRLFRTYLDKEYKFHLKTNPSILFLRNVSGEVSQTTTVLLNFLKLIRETLILFVIFILLILSDFVISFSIFIFMAFFVIIFFRFTKKKIIEKNGRLIQKIRKQFKFNI